jgi:phage shock protein PspC (stress-responsive transcriptional regulator)
LADEITKGSPVTDDTGWGREETKEGAEPRGDVGPPRLERRRSERILGGVASGVADHFDLDPLPVRVAFVALAFFGGSGVLLYVLGWLFIPEEGSEEPALVLATRDIGVRKLAALALFGAALLLVSGPLWMLLLQGDYVNPSLLWSLLLVGLGFLLLRGEAPRPPDPPQNPGGASKSLAVRSRSLGERFTTPRSRAGRQERPPRVRRKRSTLGWIAVGTMLFVVGTGALLDRLGLQQLKPKDLIGAAVVVLGAALIVGAFKGRARWLIPLGLLLLPPLLLANLLSLPRPGAIGSSWRQPRTAASLRQGYRVLAGGLGLDLTRVDFNQSQTVELPLDVVAGSLDVTVPRGVTIDLDSYTGLGSINFLGRERHGTDIDFDSSFIADEGSSRRLVLRVNAGIGDVRIYRSGLVKDLRAAASSTKKEDKKPESKQKREEKQ